MDMKGNGIRDQDHFQNRLDQFYKGNGAARSAVNSVRKCKPFLN